MKNKTSAITKTPKSIILLLFVIIVSLNAVFAQAPAQSADEAIAALTAKITAAPNDANLYAQRGTIYLKTGKPAEALADAEKAVEINPKNPNALNLRGNVKSVKKDFSGAIADYTQVIKLYPDKAFNSYFWRGELLEIKSDLQSALADYQKAIEIEPKYTLAAKARDRVDAKIKTAQTPPKDDSPKTQSSSGTSDEFLSLTTSALGYLQETKVYKDKYESPNARSGKEGEKEALELTEILYARSQKTVETLTYLINRFSGNNYSPQLIQTRGKLEVLLATNKRTVNYMAGAKIFHRISALSYESQEKEKALENQIRAAEKAGDKAARESAYNKYIAQIEMTDKVVSGGALELGALIKSMDQQFVAQNLRNLEITLSTTASQASVKKFLINKPPQKN